MRKHKRWWVGLAAGLAACGAMTGSGDAAARGAAAARRTVTIDATRFSPEVLTIRVRDTVVWVNKDPFPHTVAAKEGSFASREIQPGKSWTYTATKPGEYAYICTLHPTMKATLRVQ